MKNNKSKIVEYDCLLLLILLCLLTVFIIFVTIASKNGMSNEKIAALFAGKIFYDSTSEYKCDEKFYY